MTQNNIRNFCIIAHIDHGKSTLADRFLELTKTVEKRQMKAQLLDQLDLERERGITIKLQPVTMNYRLPASTRRTSLGESSLGGQTTDYQLNLIDTPGHVDFTYEVSRSLAAVEGAVLLVDATQGIQAQTLANFYLAFEQGLKIIPVINKIDLPAAQVEKCEKEICHLLECKADEILHVSAKTGQGVEEVLQKIVKEVPGPQSDSNANLKALVFDSVYDDYRGVIAYVRLVEGQLKSGDEIYMLGTKAHDDALEVGLFKPQLVKKDQLNAGEIGYIVTGFKQVDNCRVGDTLTLYKNREATKSLPGYKEVKPMVYAGFFIQEGQEYGKMREAIEKLKLNDAALFFEPERSVALGFGFRCGFLGLLHLEIVQERLKREYGLELVVTVPSVAYNVYQDKGQMIEIKSPQELPDPSQINKIEEPWVKADIISPSQYIGSIMSLVQDKRGEHVNTEYLDQERVILHYQLPLASILVDFYDKLKSVSSGYASLNYEFMGYRPADVVKMDILVAEDMVEALSTIVYRDTAFETGKKIVGSLKKTIPRGMFEIKLQAAIGGKVIASERISPMRKDVTANLYGGDVTRKRKLLEKQKKGKKKMKALGKGSVEIPTEAYMSVLKR